MKGAKIKFKCTCLIHYPLYVCIFPVGANEVESEMTDFVVGSNQSQKAQRKGFHLGKGLQGGKIYKGVFISKVNQERNFGLKKKKSVQVLLDYLLFPEELKQVIQLLRQAEENDLNQ